MFHMVIRCLIFFYLIYSGLFEMVCPNGTKSDVSIPVVMISKTAGENFKNMLMSGKKGLALLRT